MEMDDWTKTLFGNRLVILETPQELAQGLLKYEKPPYGHAFLFKFPDEEIRIFTTENMKFNIDILFFDENKEIVHKELNCPPGNKYSSVFTCKYVIEVPIGPATTLHEVQVAPGAIVRPNTTINRPPDDNITTSRPDLQRKAIITTIEAKISEFDDKKMLNPSRVSPQAISLRNQAKSTLPGNPVLALKLINKALASMRI